MKLPAAAVALLLLPACSKTSAQPAPASSAAPPAVSAPAAAAAPTPDPKAGVKTALAFMTALNPTQTKALDVRSPVKRYTADTDPNHMLGRQHGYIEKITFGAHGGNGSIEVFPNLEDAKARQAYLDKIGQASPTLGDGYDYLNEKRFALLRLPHEVTPDQAKQWKMLLDGL